MPEFFIDPIHGRYHLLALAILDQQRLWHVLRILEVGSVDTYLANKTQTVIASEV
mgnify:CR=1 FL=1